MNQGISERREQVTALYVQQSDRVRRMVARTLRPAGQQFADWTGADFDSYQVLAEIGVANPAAAVSRARAARPARRAVRTALRSVRRTVRAGVAA